MSSAVIGFIGVLIGAFATIIGQFIPYWIKKQGKAIICLKFVGDIRKGRPWGIYNTDQGLSFHVPLWIEITNAKGVPLIIRNVSLSAFDNGSLVEDFTQIQAVNGIKQGNDEKYTFVIQGYDSQKYNLLYALRQNEINGHDIDELRIEYADVNNKVHRFHLMNIPDDFTWEPKEYDRPKEWIILEK